MTNARNAKNAREKAAAMRAEAARKEQRARTLVAAVLVIAVAVIAVGGFVLVRHLQAEQKSEAAAASAPPANVADDGAIVVGEDTAPVTMEVYEDFICPACGNFESLNADQLDAYVEAGTLKIEYRPIALLDQYSTDDYSTRALNAVASVVNTQPDLFVDYHRLLFANQPDEGGAGLTDDQLIDLAVQAGATETDVRPAVEALTYQGWTEKVTEQFTDRMAEEGEQAATPSVYIEGVKLDDYAAATVKAAIDAAAGVDASASATATASASASATATSSASATPTASAS